MRVAAKRTICSCRELSSRYGTARNSGRSSHSPQTTARVTTTQGPNQDHAGAASGSGGSAPSGRGRAAVVEVTTRQGTP